MFTGWKRHSFCAILNIHKPGIYLSQAMKLASKLPAWADSFYNAPGSVIEAFLFYLEKREMRFDD
jgi:hypothetical protein